MKLLNKSNTFKKFLMQVKLEMDYGNNKRLCATHVVLSDTYLQYVLHVDKAVGASDVLIAVNTGRILNP